MHSARISSQTGRNLQSIGKISKNKRIYQRGYGALCNKSYYVKNNQYGRGIGSIFLGLSRFLIPLLQSSYRAIKDEALSAGSDILQEVSKKGIDSIVKDRSRKAVQNLKDKAVQKLDTMMSGSGNGCKKRKTATESERKVIKRRKNKKNNQTLLATKRSTKRKENPRKNHKKINTKPIVNKKKLTSKEIRDIFG